MPLKERLRRRSDAAADALPLAAMPPTRARTAGCTTLPSSAGVSTDAASRAMPQGAGLSVLLAEKDDLASGTSSASTKLIHGGLRYLEQYDFRLVRESLREREVLLGIAPHIIRPMRFVLPHHHGLRPAFLIRLGPLPLRPSGRTAKPAALQGGRPCRDRRPAQPLKPGFTRGFEYSDCWVDDARLVVLNAMDAAARGADIRVRTEVDVSATEATTTGRSTCATQSRVGTRRSRRARWSTPPVPGWPTSRRTASDRTRVPRVRLVRGSHIVVRKLFDHGSAYIFQNSDRRIIFAIPYERDYTLIGTTDVDFAGDIVEHRDFRRGDRLPLRGGERILRRAPSRRPTWSGAIPVFAPCRTMAEFPPRTQRATLCSRSTGDRASRRFSASSAARSRPIGISPKKR